MRGARARFVAFGLDKEVAVNRSVTIAILAIAGLCLSSSNGAAQIGLRAIEGRVGFVAPESDIGSTFLLGAGIDLGTITPEIRLEGGFDFWTKGYDAGYGFATAEWSVTNFAVTCGARFDFPTGIEGFLPFAFGGLGFHYFRTSWSCENCTAEYGIYGQPISYGNIDDSDSSMEFGINLGVGGEIQTGGSITPSARIGYNLNGGADYFFIMGGLRFPLGT